MFREKGEFRQSDQAKRLRMLVNWIARSPRPSRACGTADGRHRDAYARQPAEYQPAAGAWQPALPSPASTSVPT